MKLEPPLASLFARRQTLCVAECCGIDAYDLNPIHIASFLLMYRGAVDESEVARVRSQLVALQANYGSQRAGGAGVTLDELNQRFSASEVDDLVKKVVTSLDRALELIETVDSMTRSESAG